ncbi:MAG: gamma carbonic anhydrase family protein [Gemmatimonadota bacterium]|nr:gamma carbonic anhydrase family protein [Gemmatimonadota bacterium]
MRPEEVDALRTARHPTIDATAFIAGSADVVGDVTVGPESSIWYGCVLRGDIAPIVVGARTNIQDLTVVHVDRDTPTRIGDDVGVGHRAIIHGCVIEDRCLIGMGAIVLSHARIGAGSVIAAGALVTEGVEVPPHSLVVGVPGRVVRPVDEELAERAAMTVRSYRLLRERHRDGRWSGER